jgi:hypothetical protein
MNDQVTPEQFLVFLFALLCGCGLACLYWYWQFGTGPAAWMVGVWRWWQSTRPVKTFAPPAASIVRELPQTAQTDQTDAQTDRLSAADLWLDRLELDRTREVVIEVLVYSGWGVADFRKAGVLRGDNTAIGQEIEAAKQRLGMLPDPPREILVNNERRIPLDERPIKSAS